MLTERQQAWIDRLRSGEERQATEVLEDSSGARCCLGVYLFNDPFANQFCFHYSNSGSYTVYEDTDHEYEWEDENLPPVLVEEIGLSPKAHDYIAAMNDNNLLYRSSNRIIRYSAKDRRNFNFIARWLEIYFTLRNSNV